MVNKLIPIFIAVCLINSTNTLLSQRIILNTDTLSIYNQLKKPVYSFRNNYTSFVFLPPMHYNHAFFCRMEAAWNRSRKMPAYFRLGNKEYVDYLENKN